MCTSMVRDAPTTAWPHTSLARSSRLFSWPGSEANAASSSNSLSLKESGSPLTHAVKFFVSSRSSPASMILPRAPLEVGVDSCCKLLCAKWLHYVVVSTGLEALDLIFLSVFCGNHDNYDVGVFSTYLLANLNPVVLAGKHKVEQDEVRAEFSG